MPRSESVASMKRPVNPLLEPIDNRGRSHSSQKTRKEFLASVYSHIDFSDYADLADEDEVDYDYDDGDNEYAKYSYDDFYPTDESGGQPPSYLAITKKKQKVEAGLRKELEKVKQKVKKNLGTLTHTPNFETWERHLELEKKLEAEKMEKAQEDTKRRNKSRQDWWYGRTRNWQDKNMDKKPKIVRKKKHTATAPTVGNPDHRVDVLFNFTSDGSVRLTFGGRKHQPTKSKSKARLKPKPQPQQKTLSQSKSQPQLSQTKSQPQTFFLTEEPEATSVGGPTSNSKKRLKPSVRAEARSPKSEDDKSFEKECMAGDTLVVRERPGVAGVSLCVAIHGEEGNVDIAIV